MTSGTSAWRLPADSNFTLGKELHDISARHGRLAAWMVPGIHVGCLFAFIADLLSANTLAFGVFYTPLVASAVYHRSKHAVWVLTALACVMVVIGACFPRVTEDVPALAANRVLSICAILLTAVFVRRARAIQEQLVAQTDRAEAAERVKTEVLNSLSHEIRGPLHAMFGVLELAAAAGGPEQARPLKSIRTSGRRLVSMIDNLVDLTQTEEMSLPAEPFDLSALLCQTMEAKRRDAADRQIALTIDIPSEPVPPAVANPWAVRRILENKIGDAISYTRPGGRVAISMTGGTGPGKGGLCVTIMTSSPWPARVLHAANEPGDIPLIPSAMGLALSQRLAAAIGARLEFRGGPGDGTTVRLTLPGTGAPRR